MKISDIMKKGMGAGEEPQKHVPGAKKSPSGAVPAARGVAPAVKKAVKGPEGPKKEGVRPRIRACGG